MKTGDSRVLNLLSNNDVTFFIPPYQRNYEWDEEMCKILFNDIKNISKGNNIQHFFGSVIYYSESSIFGEPTKLILVDGQQRLTTTMLFLVAIRDRSHDASLKNTIDSKYLKNNNVSSNDTELKIKLKQVESDWQSYKNIILGKDLGEKDKETNVFKNYKLFLNLLSGMSESELLLLIEKGLNNFNIVTIQLEPEKNSWEKPQEIFESMNSLGKPLSLADLVRNYLLLGKSSDEQNHLYHNYWMKIENNLKGKDESFSNSSFIRDYMQLKGEKSYKKATDTNHKELYRNFKELFSKDSQNDLIEKLAEYSDQYTVLAGYKSSGDAKIDQKLDDLKFLESSSFYSFILGLLFLRKKERFSDEDTLQILNALFIYITRRRLLRLTQGENKEAPMLVKHFSELIESDDKHEKMLSILSEQAYYLRLPSNRELYDYLSAEQNNFYNLRSGKFVLSLIEEFKTKSRPKQNDKYLQVEHIMPQSLNESWKKEIGLNYEEVHDNYLHNIGNLTLIRHNQELSNKPFSEKKDIFRDNTGLQIAKDKIIDASRWDENEIRNRAEYLIEIITKHILPIPNNLDQSNKIIHKSSSRFSFEKLNLIGKEICFIENPNFKATVVSDREVIFEGKNQKLSPLTKECMRRVGKASKSEAYQGSVYWCYEDTPLNKLNDLFDDLD